MKSAENHLYEFLHFSDSVKDTVAKAQYEAMDDFLDAKFANVSFGNRFNHIYFFDQSSLPKHAIFWQRSLLLSSYPCL